MTRVAVVRFPGSNCDFDTLRATERHGAEAYFVWHRDVDLKGADVVILPGGFSYGDYLRAGAIARFSPIMQAVKQHAAKGGPVLGICNGFQILCETGLLPGALVRNADLQFICRPAYLRVEETDTAFTSGLKRGQILKMPVKHGEGCYYADSPTLERLHKNRQILLRYVDAKGKPTPSANPNGSVENIAGICNETRNVFGLMPHPEDACSEVLGSTDGAKIFNSIAAACANKATSHV